MRKNLLTLMLGLLFLFIGSSVAKAEVVNSVSTSAASMAEKSMLLNKMKLSFLATKCALLDSCSNARKAADIALTNAVNTCEADGWGAATCTSALDRADALSDNAILQCNQSTNIRKGTPIFLKESANKKQEDTFS